MQVLYQVWQRDEVKKTFFVVGPPYEDKGDAEKASEGYELSPQKPAMCSYNVRPVNVVPKGGVKSKG